MKEHLENFTRTKIAGTVETVTVGDVNIVPWKLQGLHLQSPSEMIFRGAEVEDLQERTILIEEAIIAAQEILKAYFHLDDSSFHQNFAGLCQRGSAIVQELLAYAQMRTVCVFGAYDMRISTPLPTDDDNLFSQDREKGHFWLYGSLTGVMPIDTGHACADLSIIDPTRQQFHPQKPTVVHIGEGKYQPAYISSSKKNVFYQSNRWLWNDEELAQWRNILNSFRERF